MLSGIMKWVGSGFPQAPLLDGWNADRRSVGKTAMGSNSQAEQITRQTKTSPADVVMWSGCKDSQTVSRGGPSDPIPPSAQLRMMRLTSESVVTVDIADPRLRAPTHRKQAALQEQCPT